MLTRLETESAAATLEEADRTRTQIGLLSQQYPAITLEDAYAIQRQWVAKKAAADRRIIGHKIGLTSKAMQQALDITAPALEIIDTRIVRADPVTKTPRRIFDTIAANAGIVMDRRSMRPDSLDLRWAGAIVLRNAAVEETGLAAGVLNHPAEGIVWLLRRLAEQEGHGLKAGELVLSGSFIRPIEVSKGDTIHADFGPMGTVSCYFS
jgi:2-oxo-hept-3-ene-1,7-dioate hydratase